MFSIELKFDEVEKFINTGLISYSANKNSTVAFLERLPELDFLIEKAFAEIVQNLNYQAFNSIKYRLIRSATILPISFYEKDIHQYQELQEGHCILQLKENTTPQHIFREEEILTLEKEDSRFSQVSRKALKDKNDEICFIKMHAILKIQNATYVIQMTYAKLGESCFYEYENNLIFFIHPIYIEQIVVNRYKSGLYNTFKKYFLQEYDIEKSYSKEEQKKCTNLRLAYNPMCQPCVPLSIAKMIGFYF